MKQAIIFDLGGVLVHIGGIYQGNTEKLMTLDTEGFAFAKRCKAQGMRLLLLTHCGRDSLKQMQAKFPELFALFDTSDIYTPAHLGFTKSEPACFEEIVVRAGLDKQQTIFIDDTAEHVGVARQVGIAAIVHTDWPTTTNAILELL